MRLAWPFVILTAAVLSEICDVVFATVENGNQSTEGDANDKSQNNFVLKEDKVYWDRFLKDIDCEKSLSTNPTSSPSASPR